MIDVIIGSLIGGAIVFICGYFLHKWNEEMKGGAE